MRYIQLWNIFIYDVIDNGYTLDLTGGKIGDLDEELTVPASTKYHNCIVSDTHFIDIIVFFLVLLASEPIS